MHNKVILTVILFISASLFASGSKENNDSLNVYSIMPLNISQPIFDDFAKEMNVKVDIKKVNIDYLIDLFESENTDHWGDIIFGGPVTFYKESSKYEVFFPHPTLRSNINLKSYESPDGLWTFLGLNPTVFISNTTFLEKTGLKAPTSWLDFMYPSYKNNIVLSDPRLFGNMEYVFSLTSIYGINGESKIQDKIDENIIIYEKYNDNVAKFVGVGAAVFAITDLVDAIAIMKEGYDVSLSFPKEGATYSLACTGILNNGENLNQALSFYRWMGSEKYRSSLKKNETPYIPADGIYSYESQYFDYSTLNLLEADFSWKLAITEHYIEAMK
jgi:iron(III) transport system substrate-binding protein